MKRISFALALVGTLFSTFAFAKASFVKTDQGVVFMVDEKERVERTFELKYNPTYMFNEIPDCKTAVSWKLRKVDTGTQGEPLLNPALKRNDSVTVRVCNLRGLHDGHLIEKNVRKATRIPFDAIELRVTDCEFIVAENEMLQVKKTPEIQQRIVRATKDHQEMKRSDLLTKQIPWENSCDVLLVAKTNTAEALGWDD